MTTETTVSTDEARANCQRFANAHKLVFEDRGEVGFGRPCVGFTKGNGYVEYNPLSRADDYRRIPEFADDRLYAPDGVEAYHKHDCLAVLVRDEDYDAAIRQLDQWVRHLESLGTVEVVSYETGATGFQAVISGVIGYALRVRG